MNPAREWHLFRVALQFYTRLPVRIEDWQARDLGEASKYAPLAGGCVALLSGLPWSLGWLAGQPLLGALLAVVTGILVTGAFHEDGLADALDGLGGGQNPDQILTIMKDSRVGTYGVLALIASVSLRAAALSVMPLAAGWAMLLTQHMAGRALAVSLIGALPYVQADQLSKVKPVAQDLDPSSRVCVVALAAPTLLWWPPALSLVLLGMLLGLRTLCVRGFRRRLGGYTGDLLGAAEQLTEILLVVMIAVLWPFF
ncbi:adenosylcobinamide-GDP ribazoletransferase [Hahella sp. SMD15-11]|uniref:Adenosylcobinamide-GDP ribazoletransferase n=1 Tax=Thermohahella caldifontis TaxID=3142973 RepID=A0AB39UXB1_9GAMM